jgi:hypothetical protein
MITVEKPGSPSEILEHHGTKGMKWGVRSARSKFNEANPTSKQKADAIRLARAKSNVDFTKYTNKKMGPERKAAKLVYLKNPDRATALRITRGEKVVLGILAVGIPAVGTAAVGATVGTRFVIRRHIEKKQATGGYK